MNGLGGRGLSPKDAAPLQRQLLAHDPDFVKSTSTDEESGSGYKSQRLHCVEHLPCHINCIEQGGGQSQTSETNALESCLGAFMELSQDFIPSDEIKTSNVNFA